MICLATSNESGASSHSIVAYLGFGELELDSRREVLKHKSRRDFLLLTTTVLRPGNEARHDNGTRAIREEKLT